MKAILNQVILDIETIDRLINRGIAFIQKCNCCEECECDHRRSKFERDMFWELYKRIADEFVFDFSRFTWHNLPFRWRDRPAEYIRGLWEGYFMNELADIANSDPKFADTVDVAIANERNYFVYTEKIDKILRSRFNIEDD